MKILDFKNRHQGERCFLVGTGTSLRYTDLDLLIGETSFGMKEIAPIFDYVNWRPDYYVYTTRESLFKRVDYVQSAIDVGMPSFLWSELCDRYPGDNIMWLDLMIPAPLKPGHWSDDIEEHVFTYRTIMYPVMQIAAYMGFTTFYLLGCDLNYRYRQANTIGGDSNSLGYLHAHEINIGMELAHRIAYDELRKRNISVFNATVGGSLDVYPRVRLEEIL